MPFSGDGVLGWSQQVLTQRRRRGLLKQLLVGFLGAMGTTGKLDGSGGSLGPEVRVGTGRLRGAISFTCFSKAVTRASREVMLGGGSGMVGRVRSLNSFSSAEILMSGHSSCRPVHCGSGLWYYIFFQQG